MTASPPEPPSPALEPARARMAEAQVPGRRRAEERGVSRPFSADHCDQFHWLAQEVQKDRGEATVLKLERLENREQPEIVRHYHEAPYGYCRSGLTRGA